MLPVFHALQASQIPAIFLVALIGIAGQTAENDDDHQNVGETDCSKIRPASQQKRQQNATGCNPKEQIIQLIGTVTAGHKSPQARFELVAAMIVSVHRFSALFAMIYFHYMGIYEQFNKKTHNSQNV